MEEKMSKSNTSKLHFAMFPWSSYGHFIPYLRLSNKLAEKGHKISFLLPKGAQSKLEEINLYPNRIQFFPLVVSHVDGIPPGSETTSDVPQPLHNLLAVALDRTRDQVEAILGATKPNMVFYNLGYWIPALAQEIGIKSVYHTVLSACANSYLTKKIREEMSIEELIEVPSGYPSYKVKLKPEEAATATFLSEIFGIGLSFQDRILTSMKESDVIVYRTYREIEGSFCDYVAQASQTNPIQS